VEAGSGAISGNLLSRISYVHTRQIAGNGGGGGGVGGPTATTFLA